MNNFQNFIINLQDILRSVTDHPAEWPEDALWKAAQLAAEIKGNARTEQLYRTLTRDEGERDDD